MKKLICLLLVAVLLFVPATAFALTDSDSVAERMAGDPLDVQLQKILNSPYTTPYQKELALEKYNFLTSYAESSFSDDARTDYYCFIPVVQYTQGAGNWCGPATIYQTLKYINGSSPSQQQIANSVIVGGLTSIPNLISYLNNNQSRNSYMSTTFSPNQTNFFNGLIKTTIVNCNAPVIAIFRPTRIPNLVNPGSGMHYANIRGQSGDGGTIYMVDPYYHTIGGSNYYTVTRDALMSAILDCDAGCRELIY